MNSFRIERKWFLAVSEVVYKSKQFL